MYIQSPPLGKLGWLPDQPAHRLPVGGWSDVKNIRFDSGYCERIKEVTDAIALPGGQSGKWFQLYEDGDGAQVVAATDTKLYRLNATADGWDDVSQVGDYTSGGNWQSFQLGTSVVFNNGIEPPQILYTGDSNFRDLPNWGVIGGEQKIVRCASIRLYEPYMVCVDVTIDGVREANAVMWSDPIIIDNVTQDADMPSWDYESTTTTAGKNPVGVDEGPLIDSLTLNNNHIIYAQGATYIMQRVGGTFIFNFRRIFSYGLIQLNAVCQFKNFHFVVSRTNIYAHDGSTVTLIGEDRVQETFYERLLFDFDDVSCTENQNTKEIHVLFNSTSTLSLREYLIYNYREDNWSIGQAFTTQNDVPEYVAAMGYGFELPQGATTWATWTSIWAVLGGTTWASLRRDGNRRVMYWLTDKALYKADEEPSQDVNKLYRLYSEKIDFSEIAPQMTTNNWKHLSQAMPHIDGSAPCDFTFGWDFKPNAGTNPGETVSYDPLTQYKIDYRITGRWLSMDVVLTGSGDWRLAAMDYDMEPVHGR